MGDKKEHLTSKIDTTRVDLGDDLLESAEKESARVSSIGVSPGDPLAVAVTAQNIPELIENATILWSEGFPEDAKKIFHKILIFDPLNAVAQEHLKQICDFELKELFEGSKRRRPISKTREENQENVDSEALLKRLDQDLGLGLLNENSEQNDPKINEAIYDRIEKELLSAQASITDWMDVGIAFLEMDYFGVAIRIFSSVCRKIDPESEGRQQLYISSHCLLALALILSGKPHEAVSKIQPLLRDGEIKREDKIELLYLMGRTYELMKNRDLAITYYQQVFEMDPRYRDIDFRIRVV